MTYGFSRSVNHVCNRCKYNLDRSSLFWPPALHFRLVDVHIDILFDYIFLSSSLKEEKRLERKKEGAYLDKLSSCDDRCYCHARIPTF